MLETESGAQHVMCTTVLFFVGIDGTVCQKAFLHPVGDSSRKLFEHNYILTKFVPKLWIIIQKIPDTSVSNQDLIPDHDKNSQQNLALFPAFLPFGNSRSMDSSF